MNYLVCRADIRILPMASITPLLQWLEQQQPTPMFLQHPFTLLLLIIFPVFILVKLSRGIWSQKPNLPPSPPTLPFIGNLHQLSAALVHRSLQDLSDKYGPLMLLHLGSVPTLVVSSAEIAREILTTQDIAYASRPFTTGTRMLFYGYTDICFCPYGDYLQKMRKISTTQLLSTNRVQSFKFVREEEVALVIQKIRDSSFQGHSVNLRDLVASLSNNIICRCTIGRKNETGDGENKLPHFTREIIQLLGAFSFGDLFPLLGWMDGLTGLRGKMKKLSRKLDALFDEIIDEHAIRGTHIASHDKIDFVDILLQVQQDETLDIKFTRDNIKAMLLDMFVAGTDASSTTIEWAIAELMKHPTIMKKAQEEVRRVVAKKSKVEEDDISQMYFLKAIVKETLRLHPPGPVMIPHQTSTTTNVKGFQVPSRTTVLINIWAIMRDSKIWDTAEDFAPERFVNNPIDFKGQDYAFIPFGSGRRMCPGMSFGAAVIELAMANLLYWFDWELPDGANMKELDMTETFAFGLNKKVPLHLVAKSHFS